MTVMPQFEVRKYKSLPPFNGEYYAIFRDNEKTNFWADANDAAGIEKLHKFKALLDKGIIDKNADDWCASLRWKPENVRVLIWLDLTNKEQEAIRKMWEREIHSITGSPTQGREQEYIDRAITEEWTQYCKILNDDLTDILKNVLVVIYPYGATYIAE